MFFWDPFLLDPQASKLNVATWARHDEIEESETTKDWYTDVDVMVLQGIQLKAGQAGFDAARKKAVEGLPVRDHRHKPLADLGYKEYYF